MKADACFLIVKYWKTLHVQNIDIQKHSRADSFTTFPVSIDYTSESILGSMDVPSGLFEKRWSLILSFLRQIFKYTLRNNGT